MNRVKESIRIKDFLTIKDAFFEVKAINILIGEQAQGKSIIAKLVYFFRKFIYLTLRESIRNIDNEENLNKRFISDFEMFFPSYIWDKQTFYISYVYEEHNIIVSKKNNGKLNLEFNKRLKTFYFEVADKYRKYMAAVQNRKMLNFIENDLDTNNFIIAIDFIELMNETLFVPASRSFFTLLQRNIFTLLAKGIEIDPIMKEFGSSYEWLKRIMYTGQFKSSFSISKIDSRINEILLGNYIYDNEQDWIENGEKKINLMQASSGQQEVLPMLLTLRYVSEKINVNFFIEEPETHLYPSSQKKLISLFTYLHNTAKHSFFITTHSPYILTAINNLVIAKDAYQKAQNHPENLEKLKNFFKEDEVILLEDVSAYTLKNGKLCSIIDKKNRLIGANLLDAVSDEFQTEFDVAAEILYGDN